MRAEGYNPVRCDLADQHVPRPKPLVKFEPTGLSLRETVRPEFKEKFDTRIVGQDAVRSTQSVKLVSLDIHFDKIHTLAGLEVVIERNDFDGYSTARISFGSICPVINV